MRLKPATGALLSDQMSIPCAKAVNLASCAAGLCVPLGDAESCRSLVGQDLQQLDDCVEFLVLGHKVKEDAAASSGPPRLKYESPGTISTGQQEQIDQRDDKDEELFVTNAGGPAGCCTVIAKDGVSFDWLAALGCLNCGTPIELRRDIVAAAEEAEAAAAGNGGAEESPIASERAVLRCHRCGQDIAPLHTSDESESLVDRMFSNADGKPRFCSGGVYMYGSRKCYNFGSVGKRSWQQRFLGAEFEEQQLRHHLKIMLAVGEGGGKSTCRETCEKCGHNEAFFSTFQARSADEGMTVMYECTSCHHRRVFNN